MQGHAARAVTWLDKTQWAEGKPRHWEKDQNPGHSCQTSACSGRGRNRQKEDINTIQSHSDGSEVLPALAASPSSLLHRSKKLGCGQRMGNPVTKQGLTNIWQQKSLRDICPKQKPSTDGTTGCKRYGVKRGPCFMSLVCEGENGQGCKRWNEGGMREKYSMFIYTYI